jgi:ankyrin repeat protein
MIWCGRQGARIQRMQSTGWYEMIDHPTPRPTWESAIYGAAGIARHPELTRLLLAANPALKNTRNGRSATAMAARRGRGDVLTLLEQRGIALDLDGVDRLIAACARDDREAIGLLVAREPNLAQLLVAEGGTLLAEFAGNGDVEGLQCLLDLGVSASEVYTEGDPYFDIARDSSALHVAAWRAWPSAVKELVKRGAPVNALDGKGHTALALAVKACVDSYWTARRSPDSVEAMLRAGASVSGIQIPSGYNDIDELLREYADKQDRIRIT